MKPPKVRCLEHGVTPGTWKRDPKMRALGYFTCRACARLNSRTWVMVNRQRNRDRAAAWYAVPENRRRVLDRQASQRAAAREIRP